jgi:hypothetical protein
MTLRIGAVVIGRPAVGKLAVGSARINALIIGNEDIEMD